MSQVYVLHDEYEVFASGTVEDIAKTMGIQIRSVEDYIKYPHLIQKKITPIKQYKAKPRTEITKHDMSLIHAIEKEYGSITDTPSDDPRFIELNKKFKFGNKRTKAGKVRSYDSYKSKRSYDHDPAKVKPFFEKTGLTGKDFSLLRGKHFTWYSGSFIKRDYFLKEDLKWISEYFDVSPDVFLKEEVE